MVFHINFDASSRLSLNFTEKITGGCNNGSDKKKVNLINIMLNLL